MRSIYLFGIMTILISSCVRQPKAELEVPHAERWGIYELDPGTGGVNMIYSTPGKISGLRVNSQGEFAFSHQIAGAGDEYEEIATLNPDGTDNTDITPDYFPPGFLIHTAVFSPDDTRIYFIGEWWE